MYALHGLWISGRLHLWGEDAGALNGAERHQDAQPIGTSDHTAAHPWAMSAESLRQVVGDSWDGLLAAGAVESSVVIHLPSANGRPQTSPELASYTTPTPPASSRRLASWWLPCLEFGAADAVDLLTALPPDTPGRLRVGQSLRFWSRLACLVVDLLAAQRFVPDVIGEDQGRHRAHWRPVLDDLGGSEPLAALIAAMPPVCRSAGADPRGLDSRALVEDFLLSALDAMVRRSLADDPLIASLEQHGHSRLAPEIRWLRALVGTDSRIAGSPEDRVELASTIRSWVERVDDVAVHAGFRTCFRLNPPELPDDSDSAEDQAEWTVSFHLQATDDPDLLMNAERIWSLRGPATLLRGQDQMLREQLEADLRRAAHFFVPLTEVLDTPDPTGCTLDTEGAYSFLRESAPLLELNGFGVVAPHWCSTAGPRLGLRLQIRSAPSGTPLSPRLGLDALVDYQWQVALGDELLSEEEFRRLCAKGRSLIRFRGRWVETRPEALRAALKFMQKKHTGQATLFQALRMSIGGHGRTGLPITGIDASGWLQDALDNIGTTTQTADRVPQPTGFRGQLRPYQLRGLSWLAFLDRYGLGGCLADDMGLGKTIQLIALLLHERAERPEVGPSLLVVPMSLVGNWHRELARFAPSLKVMVHHGVERLSGAAFVAEVAGHDAVISTYGLTHRDFDHLAKVDWHRVVLDEAQNIKNPSAKQTAAVRQLRSRHRLGLTGTPLENRLSELWSIVEFLNPGLLGTAAEFRRQFAIPIEKHHDTERGEQLRRLIRPFLLRRAKSDPGVAPDLPEKMEMRVFCNLSREQATLYQAVLDDMLGDIDASSGMRRRGLVLAALTRLKQICNHPACGRREPQESAALAGRSGKCERLAEMLEEVLAEGERTLVFTQFRRMGHLLERYLHERLGCGILYLHGGTPAKGRDAMVERFQSDDPEVPVFLLSLKAGGFGLNLTSANHVFHFDRWWNPAVEDQASDRAHRIGQTRKVQIHKFVCLGTLEERIDAMLERKRGLAEQIIGRGEQWLTELSTDKLREVLALSQDAVAED